MRSRLAFVDLLRAACVLYIVGFWHLLNYTSALPGYANPLSTRATVIVLGLFVFISGHLLGQQKLNPDRAGLSRFFTRRITRIYPLYLGALGLFWGAGLVDKLTAVKAALLVSMLYGPPPQTLWFITMLLVFYCSAPALILAAGQSARFAPLGASLMLILATAVSLSPAADERIVIYFPAFVLGIHCAAPSRKRPRGALLSALALLAVALSFMDTHSAEKSLFSIPLASLCPLWVFSLLEREAGRVPRSPVIETLSYASFAMYLIHRPLFSTLKSLYFPESGAGQLSYLVLACLPAIFLCAWLVQKGYDTLLAFLRNRREVAAGVR
ncbi:acyltransferase family protein [Niveibacterium terrae]|uniref:acyltransferase family protein n=1 Tax=Niveibacterium terrae TaxID=3373598 RepID=UPI003A9103D7